MHVVAQHLQGETNSREHRQSSVAVFITEASKTQHWIHFVTF